MDNITHTLLGIAAGEALATTTKKARTPLWIASGLANNLPDLDLLLTTFFFKTPLDYLLHHRGHSHTVVLAPVLSLVLLGILYLFWRKKIVPWKEIIFLVLLGPPLHLLADYGNSYGVHPFWPVNQEWFYGDMIFIVEPWLWVLLLPALFFACTTKWGKGLCVLLLALILGLAWHHPSLPWPLAATLTATTAFLFFLYKNISQSFSRITLALGFVCLLLLSLGTLSQSFRKTYQTPGRELVLQPMPANPFCWSAIEAGFQGDQYIATLSQLAPFPKLWPATRCPTLFQTQTTAPLIVVGKADTAERKYIGLFQAPRAELDFLRKDCRVATLLHFARAPYWKKTEDGWIVGDLRFDRGPELGFCEFSFPDQEAQHCPAIVPPWRGRFL